MAKRNPRIKVLYQKLGRERVWGDADDVVRMDERAKGKKKMEVLFHECFHVLFPHLSEEEIESKSIRLTKTAWYEGLRFTDNDDKTPLQDGSK